MTAAFDDLRRRLGEIEDLVRVGQLLAWDEETKMPPAGADARAEQRATVQRLTHELKVASELGELLEDLRSFEAEHDYDSLEASLIRVTRRDHDKAVRVPPELRAEMTRAGSRGYRAWLQAREQEDFHVLLPHLERQLELRREYISCFDPPDDPYDVLLDEYEPGMKTADVQAVFDRLKEELVPMMRALAEADDVDDSCLRVRLPKDAQRRFAVAVLERWGMDRASWRLDRTVHPFAAAVAPTDIRLTTNFEHEGFDGILSCLHEFGHGLYERQIDPAYARTPLAVGVSYAFHESQSRMWENLVGRALSTWTFLYPLLQNELPDPFASVPLDAFHRALNRVHPSLRRVDADEVTYCLHIILRFELEREMLAGTLALTDLPEAFEAKMRDYLGLRPPDVVQGVLQDPHWSDGSLGYFPTYALGNVISVQLWQRAEADLGDLDEQFERGDFAALRRWLAENVHRHGRAFTPEELLRRVTGGGLDAGPYLGYLRRKLGELYGAALA